MIFLLSSMNMYQIDMILIVTICHAFVCLARKKKPAASPLSFPIWLSRTPFFHFPYGYRGCPSFISRMAIPHASRQFPYAREGRPSFISRMATEDVPLSFPVWLSRPYVDFLSAPTATFPQAVSHPGRGWHRHSAARDRGYSPPLLHMPREDREGGVKEAGKRKERRRGRGGLGVGRLARVSYHNRTSVKLEILRGNPRARQRGAQKARFGGGPGFLEPPSPGSGRGSFRSTARGVFLSLSWGGGEPFERSPLRRELSSSRLPFFLGA
jgi:hypothetical protein